MDQLGLGVVSLLRAAWFLATLPIVVAWFPLSGLAWLHTALLKLAKRGKILQSNNRLTVPQRFFAHFYVVGILWTTILLVAVWFYAVMNDQLQEVSCLQKSWSMMWVSVFMLLLMEAQVLRRFYESIYVFNYSPSARMHIIGYLVGIFYYVATPLSLCCTFATEVFNFVKNRYVDGEFVMNGKDPMLMRLEFKIWMFVTPLLRLPWYAWIGATIFLWGWVHQLRCHQILGGSDLSLWLLFAFVVANLGFAAMITHGWYLQKFEDYPRNRCAIFPFLY